MPPCCACRIRQQQQSAEGPLCRRKKPKSRSRGARLHCAAPRSHAVSAFPQPAGALATCSLQQPAHGRALQPTADRPRDRPHARCRPPSRADRHHQVGGLRHCRAGDCDAARPGVGALREWRRAQRAARQAPQAPAEGGVPPSRSPHTPPHTPEANPPHTAPETPALSLRVTRGLEWRALGASLGAGMSKRGCGGTAARRAQPSPRCTRASESSCGEIRAWRVSSSHCTRQLPLHSPGAAYVADRYLSTTPSAGTAFRRAATGPRYALVARAG